MYIQGLKVPSQLNTLIYEGKWESFNKKSNLENITPIPRPKELHFLSHKGIKNEIENFRKLYDNDLGKYYGLVASNDSELLDNSSLKKLALDSALIIAVNIDEDAIALDYSFDKETPRVVASNWQNNKSIYWEIIASSFEEFVTKVE